ncbi:MAG TPA: DNA repair protein RadA [Clostridiaceae bacterium]|nr:DNA repair protein RadA [Clostridiaceae bacterium]
MKIKTIYKCKNCGRQESKWLGRCPSCNEWDTMEEITVEVPNKRTSSQSVNSKKVAATKLLNVEGSNSDRIITNISEFNRVMGGGIVKDSVTIITSQPGGGKSTLVLEIANDVASQGFKVLYASGEESESQIKNRADRILNSISENLWIISDTNMDNVLESVKEIDPDLIIIDSIQTFTLEAFPESRAGSPTQTMECASTLVRIAKNEERPRAVIIIGQMTKEDELAGLRALEHLVDAVLYIESESSDELRSLLATKNRFGSTGEMGFFTMTERGMISIDNPSEYFMTNRSKNELVPGSAITVLREGTRPIIAEVESLVTKTFTPFPSRISEAIKREQLSTLISILEQRGKISLYDKDVVVKSTGGLRFKEQAVNLAVIMSIVSSVFDKGIPNDTAFISDVGLTGELKKVPSLEMRIRELDRRGFKKVYVARDAVSSNLKVENIEVIALKTLQEVIKHVFPA